MDITLPSLAIGLLLLLIPLYFLWKLRTDLVRPTLVAALVGLCLYLVIAPQNLPPEMLKSAGTAPAGGLSFYDHVISVIPNNIVQPFLSGNVLPILLIAIAVGVALAWMKESEGKKVVVK